MAVEQHLHTSILNSLDTIAPIVLLISEPGLGAVSQTRTAVERAANELDTEVKMAGHTNQSISYIEIFAHDLNEEHAFGFGFIPVAKRLQSALDGRHTVVMIDSNDATQNDIDVLVNLLNTRSYNGVDLTNAHLIVLARDENIVQRVDHIQVLVNDPAPIVSPKALENKMGQLLTPHVSHIKQSIEKKRAEATHVDETPGIDANRYKKTL